MGKPFTVALAFALLALPLACGDDDDSTGATGGKGGSTGGSTAKGGSGGTATGGSSAKGGTGGTATGGSPAKGGTGGTATGGTATGGATTGGSTAKGGTGGTPVETGGSGGATGGGGGEETGGTEPIGGGGAGGGGGVAGGGGGEETGGGGDGGSGGSAPDLDARVRELHDEICAKTPDGTNPCPNDPSCPADLYDVGLPPPSPPAGCLAKSVTLLECVAEQPNSAFECAPDGWLDIGPVLSDACLALAQDQAASCGN